MARSIGDWFADHERDRNGAAEDEVVEAPLPWDVRSAGTATTRSARREAGVPNSPKPRRRISAAGGKEKRARRGAAPSDVDPGSPRTAVPPLSASLRRDVLAASKAHPGANARSIAAYLTRKGTPVSPAQVDAVRKAPTSPLRTGGSVRRDPSAAEKTEKIRSAAAKHPQLGAPKLFALLRSRGITVTEDHVVAVLAQLRSTTPARSVASISVGDVPAAGRAGRTRQETVLCPSCGVRPSHLGICRCS